MKSTIRSALIFGSAAILGALIWLLSPLLTGRREPWDAQSGYYYWALMVAGFAPACFSAQRFWLAAIGVWLGQLLVFLFLAATEARGGANLWPVGLIFVCLFSVLSLVGAALGASVNLLLRRCFFRGTAA